MTTIIKSLIFIILFSFVSGYASAKAPQYYYQIKIYHLHNKDQEETIDNYLKNAYLPALHRMGIPYVGVFKPIAKDTVEQLVYVFVPFKKIDELLKIDDVLDRDQQYQETGKDYLNALYNNPPYTRIESVLLKAFKGMRQPALPNLTLPKPQRVYELRSYESATENQSLNKIGMFNDAEMDIFTKLNFNAVFYGQVISGSHMPNLMYLTTFNDKADRDKHWASFGPEYKKISTLPKYQHNQSKSTVLFLYPVNYSDI